MDRSLPSTIDYSKVLPLAAPAVARRRRFFPANGTTYGPGTTNQIRIEIKSVNSLLDAQHSYLEFEFANNELAAAVGFDLGGGNVFFDRFTVEQEGRVLSRCDDYNRLHAAILQPAQDTFNSKITAGIHGGQRALNNPALLLNPSPPGTNVTPYIGARHNGNAQVAIGGTYRFTMPLTSGLFTQDKLIPLPLVNPNAPLTLVFDLTATVNIGVWSAIPAAANGYTLRAVSYNAQLIEVGRDVLDQMIGMRAAMGGTLAISGQDWEHHQGVIAAGSNGEQPVRMPARRKSIKSLFWAAQSTNYGNGTVALTGPEACFNLSFAGGLNAVSMQMKVGSVVYPPTAIVLPGNSLGAVNPLGPQSRGEAIMELAKAFGSLGFKNPSGHLNTLGYMSCNVAANLSDGDNGLGGVDNVPLASGKVAVCPFGIDLEAFQHTAIESGVDTKTLSLESNLLLDCGTAAAGSGGEAKNVHMWILYDQHYYFNHDGSVTISN